MSLTYWMRAPVVQHHNVSLKKILAFELVFPTFFLREETARDHARRLKFYQKL